jgi:ABC-type Fe3+/spermidine/putrescine transport system ATPase subunit
LLLLGEPLGALDRKLREHTQFELISIQEQLGVTFVVVTHDQEEAMTLASRIGVMNRGKIVQIGTPHQIYEFPATRFVADFIGSVNLFEGQLVEDESDYVRVACSQLPVPIYVDHGVSAAPDASLWVAIRPEKISLERQQPDSTDNWARGVIKDIADQTNLLALNAAIEAARAGEHGHGFAVVADEVRRLAVRTTDATKQVAQSIRDVQTQTSAAVAAMESGEKQVHVGVNCAADAGNALQEIVTGSRSVEEMIQSIVAATTEQSAAGEQIARSIQRMNAVSRESTEGAGESARAAHALSRRAEELQQLVSRFKA